MQPSELQQLVSAGIITSEQSHAIQIFQDTKKVQSSSGGFSHSIVTIGSILIGLGFLSLVALNWDEMTDLLKIIVLLGSMTMSYILGRFFKNQQKSLLGGSLLFLSGLLCGCSIFLIAQIYNLTWTNDILLGLWIVMILPLVYILRQKEFYYLYMILLSCVLGQFLMSHVFQTVDERTTFVLYILFGALMLLVGCLHSSKVDSLLVRLYKVFGANISMIAYFIFQVMTSFDSEFTHRFQFSSIIAGIFAVLLVGFLLKFLQSKDKEILLGGVGLLAMMMGIALSEYVLINYSIFILLCLMLMYIGHQRENTGLIKTANIYLYIFLLFLYGKYGREYENKALFFIIGGVLMIGMGLGFSRLNTYVSKVLFPKQTHNDS